MGNIIVSTRGVYKLLKSLNPYEATGPDVIPTTSACNCTNEIARILTTIFQTFLDTVKVPDDWREAVVVPIFKKGYRHLASNYRPVSLTSGSCNVLEYFVNSQIMDHCDINNIKTDKGNYYKSKRSPPLIPLQNQSQWWTDCCAPILPLKGIWESPHPRHLQRFEFYGVGDIVLGERCP